MSRRGITVFVATLAVWSVLAGRGWAQLAAPSARGLALGDAFAARARGYEAPFWNPANLGLPDGPGWSFGLAGVSAYLNNNSWSYGEISALYGEFIDDATKSKLLADVRRGDPNRMLQLAFDLGAHAIALSIGRVAVGFSAVGAGTFRLRPDAVELLLFGNVGESGAGKDFALEGSEGRSWALSAVSLSYAQPFDLPAAGVKLSIGGTLKYGIGHGLFQVLDRGSTLTADPLALDVDLEVLRSNDLFAGRMWGLDVGAAMEWGRSLALGVSVINAATDIAWDEQAFELTRVIGQADFDSTVWTDTTLAFADLSPDEQSRVLALLDGADLATEVRLGGLYRVSPAFTLSGDYVERFGGPLRSRWPRTFSLGGELRPSPLLPLRAGLATDFEQIALTGGLGIYTGPLHFDLAIGRWGAVGGDGAVGSISLSIWPGARF